MKKNWDSGKLANYIQDFIVPQRDKPKSFDGSIPWCRIEDIDGVFLSKSKSGKCVTQEAISEMPLRVFPRDTVIVSCSADLGRCAIVSTPLVTNQTFIGLVPKPTLSPLFLYHLMTSRAVELNAAATGATIKYLSQDKFKALDISVPPLAEQQRIVDLIDEAFEGVATAKANAEKNLQNARALFESYLQSVFTQRGPGWVEKHLKDVCEKITDGTHQTPTYFDEGVVFLSSRNVTNRTINWDNVKYIDAKQHVEMHKRVAPRINDILLAKNGTTGVAAIVDRDVTFDIYVSLALLRSKGELLPQLLLHFLNSPVAKYQFNKRLKGIGVPNLHLEEIREVVISFPKLLTEQKAVSSKLDDLREETHRLARLYERKLAALEALKKSLLHEAFSGQL